jgi:hypothetical protein
MKRLILLTTSLMIVFAAEVQGAPKIQPLEPEQSVSRAETVNDSMAELNRHAVSLELLGRGLLYSFNYDYLVQENIALGGGLSRVSISSGSSSASVTSIPLYANYYFTSGSPHRFFGTGGANILFASGRLTDDAQVSGSGLAGIVGGGYEYRGENGFLFRAAPYVLLGKASGLWAGLSFGYTF